MKLIATFFCCWGVASLVFFSLPLPQNISSYQLTLTVYLFIGLNLLLASSLSLRAAQDVIEMKPRDFWVYGGIVAGILVFAVSTRTLLPPNSIFSTTIFTANLLFGATIAGTLLSVAVKRLGELVPICLTAAAADLTSVIGGPTRTIARDLADYYGGGMQGQPPLIDLILVKVAIPGHEVPIPLFGVSDWIFLVLLSTALLRLKKTDNLLAKGSGRNSFVFLPVSALALYVSLVAARMTHTFLPAMVFICLGFLIYTAAKYDIVVTLRRSDLFNSVIFPAVTVILILLLG